MKLLHLSDLHFRKHYDCEGEEFSYKAIFRNMTSPLAQLDRVLERLEPEERAQLDAVLVSGDLTEDGTAEDYRLLRAGLEARFPGIPLVVTLGNHDVKAAFREGWLGQPGEETPWCHVARVGDISILALDNSQKDHPSGIIDGWRFDWLRRAAREEAGRPLVVMMHHHLLPEQAVFPACRVDSGFGELLKELGIAAILCGHTHQNWQTEYAGIPYRTAVSTSFVGIDEEMSACMFESAGFSLYTLERGVITGERHERLDLDKVLGYVHF